MLPNLPLDILNQQLRVDDIVAYSAPDSCHLFIGKIVKITPKLVWLSPLWAGESYPFKHRREFKQVVKVDAV